MGAYKILNDKLLVIYLCCIPVRKFHSIPADTITDSQILLTINIFFQSMKHGGILQYGIQFSSTFTVFIIIII